jgi:alkanesulfonate monooxygenase SsuD/methylene tetrahydromethanopterin reductase-like flavin-dependent oxidoreductase (luciferase family)
MIDDAMLAEQLGFDSFWLAEHHFWYDGWCPQPLIAASSILSATSTLRVSTAMHLLPMHNSGDVGRELAALRRMHGQRLDFGAGLGYRDEEYDGLGIARRERGRRMAAHLDYLLAEGSLQVHSTYVGGFVEAAARRAGSRGLALLLPNTLGPLEIRDRIEAAAEEADSHGLRRGRTGMLIDTWITDSSESSDRVADRLVRHYREYAGAWYQVAGSPMFTRPDLLDRQSARTRGAAVIGTADRVLDRLMELRGNGIDTFVLQVRSDADTADYRRVMHELAETVITELKAPS